jgi:hypothetical protein
MNDEQTIPVIICTYQRLERLSTTLDQLSEQINCSIDLYIWNNNPKNSQFIVDTIKNYPKLKIELHNSKHNIGGFGRFYYARTISSRYPAVIFIDDDIKLSPGSIRTLMDEIKPSTIYSFYAYKFITKENYFKRRNLKTGDEADYCGTGGMICDTSIFKEKELFNCPEKYWFIEDLWLSYYAKHILGWTLYKSSAKIKILDDDINQWVQLRAMKTTFLRYLINQGWDVAKEPLGLRDRASSKVRKLLNLY